MNKNIASIIILIGLLAISVVGGYLISTSASKETSYDLQLSNGNVMVASRELNVDSIAGFKPTELYFDVLRLVKQEYVDGITEKDDKELAYGTIRGMLAKLEKPANRFLEPEEARIARDAETGVYKGIGAALTTDERKNGTYTEFALVVISPMPGSPSAKAGLRSGDVIDAINGQWVFSYSLGTEFEELRKAVRDKKITQKEYIDAVKKLADKQENALMVAKAVTMLNETNKEPLKITIKRKGVKSPIELTVPSAVTNVEPIHYKTLPNKWGYLSVRYFSPLTTEKVNSTVSQQKSKVKGFIIDLRNNPGGNQSDALGFLGAFLPAKTPVAKMAEHKEDKARKLVTLNIGNSMKLPLIVLVNHGTFNTAEMAALALKDNLKAVVIGEPTHGDPFIRTDIPLKDGSIIKLLTGKYYGIKNAEFEQVGIKPDAIVASTDKFGDPATDPPLNRAIRLASTGGK